MFKLALPITLFVLLAVAVPQVQASPASPPRLDPFEIAQQGLPPAVAGYKVLTVLTPDTTACIPPDVKRLVLQFTQPDVKTFLSTVNYVAVKADLEQKGMAEYARWNMTFVGPGTTLQDLLSENEKWNQERKKSGCAKSQPATTGSDYQEFKAPGNGYAIYEDTDAGSFTDDYAQSINLESPAAIANRPGAVMFLNNVRTDNASFYVLQDGLQLWNGVGRLIWTDTTLGYVNQYYSFPYSANQIYWFTITYGSGLWWMCGYNVRIPSQGGCNTEPNGVGTTLGLDPNTSIYVENQNTDPNWYQGFSSPFWAYGAQIYRNGSGYYWSTQHHHTQDYCSSNWPPNLALSGTLINGYGAGWNLPNVPLLCY